MMRLNKFLAHAGVASRRKCDTLIFNGKVQINGQIVDNPATIINPDKDIIEVFGKKIKIEKKIYIALNKPKFVLSTLKDSFNRKIITDLIDSSIKERIYPVGRLDYDTTGIILLTNDGELSNRLIHPRYKVEKVYKVLIKGNISKYEIKLLEQGIIIDNKKTLPAKVKLIKKLKDNSLVEITIKEGRKRQVKKMFKAVNHQVIALQRIKFGPISIGNLKEGEWRFLSKNEINLLKTITELN